MSRAFRVLVEVDLPELVVVSQRIGNRSLCAVLHNVEHRTLKYLNNGLDRDHQQGALGAKLRLNPMRAAKQAVSPDLLAHGHACIQNLRNGSTQWASTLTATVLREPRLMTAWSQLSPAI